MTILVGGRWVLIASLAFFPLMALAESVTVAWVDNSGDEAGFKVERGVDGQNFTEIAKVGANVTTYTDATVFSATKYYYRVAAFDATRTSAYSNVTSVTTDAAKVAPAITVQPTASQTVNAGAKLILSVSANGVPSPTFQWKKNGSAIAGATASTLTFAAVADADAGNYSVVASNSAGSVSSSNALVVVQTIAVTVPPVITPPPPDETIVVPTTPPVEPLPTEPVVTTPPVESVPVETEPSQPVVTPVPDPTPVVEQPAAEVPPKISGPVTTDSAPIIDSAVNQTPIVPATLPKNSDDGKTSTEVETPSTSIPSRLMNLSVRSIPGADERALLVGFVVKYSSKTMLLRAVGPGLKTYTNVPTYGDPKLSINDGHRDIAVNDNWSGAEELRNSFLRVGAFPLSDSSADAALLTKLTPKSYTANVTGTGSGLALAEIYDADTAEVPSGRLVNLSARAYAGPGDGVLIIGFVISGDTPLRVLLRGIGPSLASKGVKAVLSDPQIELYRGNSLIQQNDDWSGSPELAAAFAQTGAFKLSSAQSKDAAMIATLSPGMYSLVVSGTGSTAGVALAEVYELP